MLRVGVLYPRQLFESQQCPSSHVETRTDRVSANCRTCQIPLSDLETVDQVQLVPVTWYQWLGFGWLKTPQWKCYLSERNPDSSATKRGRRFTPQLILNHLHCFFSEKLFLWCQRSVMPNSQSSAQPSSVRGWWWTLCYTRDRVQRMLTQGWLQAAPCSSEGQGKPLQTPLSCQRKNFSIQALKTKLKFSTAAMSGDALRQRTGNCAGARNPVALGQRINYKYEKYLLKSEAVW